MGTETGRRRPDAPGKKRCGPVAAPDQDPSCRRIPRPHSTPGNKSRQDRTATTPPAKTAFLREAAGSTEIRVTSSSSSRVRLALYPAFDCGDQQRAGLLPRRRPDLHHRRPLLHIHSTCFTAGEASQGWRLQALTDGQVIPISTTDLQSFASVPRRSRPLRAGAEASSQDEHQDQGSHAPPARI